jgi:hypothetical protein
MRFQLVLTLCVFSIALAVASSYVPFSLGLVLIYISGLLSGGVFLVLWEFYREQKFRAAERLNNDRIRTLEHELDRIEKGRPVGQ